MKALTKTIATAAVLLIIAMAATTAANAASTDPRWEGSKPDPVGDLVKKYKSAYEQGDVVKIMTLYSITVIENGNLNYQQIAQNYQKRFERSPYLITIDKLKVTKTDSSYTVTGHYKATPQKPDGIDPTEAYFSWMLAMEGTELKIIRSDYSTDGQQPQPATTSMKAQPVSTALTNNAMVKQSLQQQPAEVVRTQYEKEQFSTMLKTLKESPTPIRTPDTIVRVFILPYNDANDRLHGSTYTYLKIEDGKWLLGDYLIVRKKQPKQLTTPLDYSPPTPEEQPAPEAKKDQQAKGRQQGPGEPPDSEPEAREVKTEKATYQ